MTISDLTDVLIRLQTKYSCGVKGGWDPIVYVRNPETDVLEAVTNAKMTDRDPHGEGELVVLLETD